MDVDAMNWIWMWNSSVREDQLEIFLGVFFKIFFLILFYEGKDKNWGGRTVRESSSFHYAFALYPKKWVGKQPIPPTTIPISQPQKTH